MGARAVGWVDGRGRRLRLRRPALQRPAPLCPAQPHQLPCSRGRRPGGQPPAHLDRLWQLHRAAVQEEELAVAWRGGRVEGRMGRSGTHAFSRSRSRRNEKRTGVHLEGQRVGRCAGGWVGAGALWCRPAGARARRLRRTRHQQQHDHSEPAPPAPPPARGAASPAVRPLLAVALDTQPARRAPQSGTSNCSGAGGQGRPFGGAGGVAAAGVDASLHPERWRRPRACAPCAAPAWGTGHRSETSSSAQLRPPTHPLPPTSSGSTPQLHPPTPHRRSWPAHPQPPARPQPPAPPAHRQRLHAVGGLGPKHGQDVVAGRPRAVGGEGGAGRVGRVWARPGMRLHDEVAAAATPGRPHAERRHRRRRAPRTAEPPQPTPPAPHRTERAACVLTTVVRAPLPTWFVQIRRTPVLHPGGGGARVHVKAAGGGSVGWMGAAGGSGVPEHAGRGTRSAAAAQPARPPASPQRHWARSKGSPSAPRHCSSGGQAHLMRA